MKYKNLFEKYSKDLENLRQSTQPTNLELYQNYKNFVTVEISQKDYKIERGSYEQSYQEKTNGLVCDVKIKDKIFLDKDQIEIIRSILKNTEKFDNLNFI